MVFLPKRPWVQFLPELHFKSVGEISITLREVSIIILVFLLKTHTHVACNEHEFIVSSLFII